jgi:hypothetical protein
LATYTELKKQAKELDFYNLLYELGFTEGQGNLWFYRTRGDYIDFINISLSSTKKKVVVSVDCKKIDVMNDEYDMACFPKKFIKDFRLSSDCFMDKLDGLIYASSGWWVTSEDEKVIFFKDIASILKEHAEPWFQNITNDKKLFESYSLRMQESPFGLKLKEKLNLE